MTKEMTWRINPAIASCDASQRSQQWSRLCICRPLTHLIPKRRPVSANDDKNGSDCLCRIGDAV